MVMCVLQLPKHPTSQIHNTIAWLQTFAGPVGMFRPNISLLTDPGTSGRAIVECGLAAGEKGACIRAGDGDLEGAASLTLKVRGIH